MKILTATDFASWLRENHKGRAKAITARSIITFYASAFDPDVTDRLIRKLAAAACEAGFPVFGDSRGYFYAESREEAAEAFNRLEHQAKAMLSRVSKGRSMLDAEGQSKIAFPGLARELVIDGISIDLARLDGTAMTAREKYAILASSWLKIWLGEWLVFDTALSRWPCRVGIPSDPVTTMQPNVPGTVLFPACWAEVLRIDGPPEVTVYFYEKAGKTGDEVVIARRAQAPATIPAPAAEPPKAEGA